MEITLEYVRSGAVGEGMRAEAMVPRLTGDAGGIARFNAFYAASAEAFLRRAETLRLPTGRYAARLCAAAEWESESCLRVAMEWSLCRRGRVLESACCMHRWLLPQGYLQPRGAGDN